MKRILTVAYVSAVVFSLSAAADEPAKPDEGRRCTMEMIVGSHLPKKVCSTAAERDTLRRQSDQAMQGSRGRPSSQKAGALQ